MAFVRGRSHVYGLRSEECLWFRIADGKHIWGPWIHGTWCPGQYHVSYVTIYLPVNGDVA